MLIVAQGTGVAPFMSIFDRLNQASETQPKITMIYGVRDNSANMMYKERLEQFFTEPNTARKLIVACSRDIDESQTQDNTRVAYERGYV